MIPDSAETFTAHLEEMVPGLMRRYEVPGVTMAVVDEGRVVWTGAFGYADLEQRREMTVDAVCRVESISKSVTAWGVMRLIQEGLIDPDVPVGQYLDSWTFPDTEYSYEGVTVRLLLSNRAGMPLGPIGDEYPPDGDIPSLHEALTSEVALIGEPGSSFVYSNVGFHLLELLIEERTERQFAEYMRNEVLRPLGMEDSDFRWTETIASSIPMGYDLRGVPVPPYVYPASASGGLFADVDDIAAFVVAEMSGEFPSGRGDGYSEGGLSQDILLPESIAEIHTPHTGKPGVYGAVADRYGFGHFIEKLSNGHAAVWHGGQGHGWMTHFHCVPDTGDGIVILTNSQRSWPLISQVLVDWSRWCGFEPVKMGRITVGVLLVRIFIGVIVCVVVLPAVRLVLGLRSGSLQFAPFSRRGVVGRSLLAAVSVLGLSGLGWAAMQPYLLVTSVFPGLAGRAGMALSVLAVILIVSALFPKTGTPPVNSMIDGSKD